MKQHQAPLRMESRSHTHTALRIQTHIHTCAEFITVRRRLLVFSFIPVRFTFCFVYIFVSISHRVFIEILENAGAVSLCNIHTESVLCCFCCCVCLDLHIDGRRVSASPTKLNSQPENRKPNSTEQNRFMRAIWEIDDKTECKINGARLWRWKEKRKYERKWTIERINGNNS